MKTSLNDMTPYILSNGHQGCANAKILDMNETIERLERELEQEREAKNRQHLLEQARESSHHD